MKKFLSTLPWILVMLVLISLTSISTMTFAYFQSNSQKTATTEVATFSSSIKSQTNGNLNIDCNSEKKKVAQYSFDVSNVENGRVSQVNQKYTISLTSAEPIPNGVMVTLDGLTGTISDDRKCITFADDSWKFSHNIESTHSHTMQISADSNVVTYDVTLSNLVISVHSEQLP